MSGPTMIVAVRGEFGSSFQRSVRDESGNIVETLVFTKNEPVEITKKAQALAIMDDIGQALVVCLKNEAGIVKVNDEETEATVLDIAKAKRAEKKELTRVQREVFERWFERQPRGNDPALTEAEEAAGKTAADVTALQGVSGEPNVECGECGDGEPAAESVEAAAEPVEATEDTTAIRRRRQK